MSAVQVALTAAGSVCCPSRCWLPIPIPFRIIVDVRWNASPQEGLSEKCAIIDDVWWLHSAHIVFGCLLQFFLESAVLHFVTLAWFAPSCLLLLSSLLLPGFLSSLLLLLPLLRFAVFF